MTTTTVLAVLGAALLIILATALVFALGFYAGHRWAQHKMVKAIVAQQQNAANLQSQHYDPQGMQNLYAVLQQQDPNLN
jgi:hypothetical protein